MRRYKSNSSRIYHPEKGGVPFWLVLVAVMGVCFALALFWPRASAKPAAPLPLVSAGVVVKSGPIRWGGQRDVVALGDPGLDRRRAIRDAQRGFSTESYIEEGLQGRVFAGCHEARAAGRENIPIGDPAYHPDMDGDGDGLACEPIRQ